MNKRGVMIISAAMLTLGMYMSAGMLRVGQEHNSKTEARVLHLK